MDKRSDKSKIIKEIYRSGQERVRYLQNLVGNAQLDTLTLPLSEEDWDRFRQVLVALRDSFQFDRSEDYKKVMVAITAWSLEAIQEPYRKLCLDHKVSLYYALRKGLECMQVVLYRDLRRMTLESEESRRYHVFCEFARGLPSPSLAAAKTDTDQEDAVTSIPLSQSGQK